MRLLIVTVVSSLLLAGCAIWSKPSTPAAAKPDRRGKAAVGTLRPPPATPPTPRTLSGPETVGAAELRVLHLTRATALRQQPAAGAERFGALKAGDVVLKLDARGPWYRVWVPGVALSGWIEKGTAAAGPGDSSAALSPVPVTELSMVTVSRTGARLRSAPSARGRVLRALARGEALRLLSEQGSWLKVYDPGAKAAGYGYIASQLVERPR
jgi:hypothetical protein